MPRYALKIEYEGAAYKGWQRQKDQPSIQGAIEDSAEIAGGMTGYVQGAGRTDRGVHATGQVAHIDMISDWDPFRLMQAINQHLKPQRISVIDCARVSDDFHARFSALERRYHFRLIARRSPAVIDEGLAWQVKHPLDIEKMRKGAAFLIGTHDFTTFRSSICQAKSPIKTLDELSISEHEYPYGREFHFTIRARSFLHNQVRSFVGTLERVGTGRWAPEKVREALEARDRDACGPVCPAHGLYLASVTYDPDPFKDGPPL